MIYRDNELINLIQRILIISLYMCFLKNITCEYLMKQSIITKIKS